MRLAALAGSVSALFGQVGQQPAPPPEPEIVTVSARALPVSAVSASVTLVTRQEIEESRAQTVVELLREVPFLYLSRTGGAGGLASVSIRGGDPNFTLVQMDGVAVNDPTNLLGGSFDFSSVSLDNLERIEIVRGPLSSLYGSEAIGGVVNLVSRKGEGRPSVTVSALGGNFGTWQVGGASSGRVRDFSYAFSGSLLEVGEQVESDTFSLGTLAWNSGVLIDGNQNLEFRFRLSDRDSSGFPENGGGPEFSLLRDPKTVDAREIVLDVRYDRRLGDRGRIEVGLDYFDRDERAFTPPILDSIPPGFNSLPSFRTETRFDRLRFGISSSWDIGTRWTTDVGLAIRRENGTSDGLIADFLPSEFALRRDRVSLGAELRYDAGDLHVTLGAGWDNSDDFDSELSPRVGVAYTIRAANGRFRTSWGEGYKLPSFFALGEPNTGNPGLVPERSRGFDVGYEQQLGGDRVFAGVTYFRNRFHDLIDFSPDEFRLVNRSEATTQGVELELRARVTDGLRLGGYLGYLDAEIEGMDEPLRDRPRWRGGVSLDWYPTRRIDVVFKTLWVGRRFDFQLPVPDLDQVDGYTTSSLAVGYRFPNRFEIFGRIDNLFDVHYHEFVGFPDPGFYGRIGVQYRFE